MSIRAELKYHFNAGYYLWRAVVTWLWQIKKDVDLMEKEQIKAIHFFRRSESAACMFRYVLSNYSAVCPNI